MNILKVVLIAVLTLSLTPLGFTEEVNRTAKIISLEGKVQVKPEAEKKWIPAEIGMVLKEGDTLRAKKNSSALLNVNGTGQTATVEVEENSQLILTELIKDEEKQTQSTLLDLAIGKVLIKAKEFHEESKFEVKTPTSVIGVRGTAFSVEVEALE